MTTSHQPGSPVVDLDELESEGHEWDHGQLLRAARSLGAELRTLRARVAELETDSTPADWNAAEVAMNKALDLQRENEQLRARVAEFEMPDTEADRILTMSDEELDAEIRAVGIDPVELDKRASHVAKWAAECSKLRARVGELEEQNEMLGMMRTVANDRITDLEARVKELEAVEGFALNDQREALITAHRRATNAESRITDLESQLAAALEGKARLDAERTRLVFEGFTYADVFRLREESELEAKVREVLGERFDHLNARRCIVNGETEWFADTRNIWPRHSFVSAPTLPALLRAILECEKGGGG